MTKPTTLEQALARLTLDAPRAAQAAQALRERMAPPLPYHNEAHIRAVLTTLLEGDPAASQPLVAAALYHDAVYDATRSDNEERSARFCTEALRGLALPATVGARAAELILITARHFPPDGDADAALLCDADLWILGSEPAEYDRYAAAIRAEYAHVEEEAYRTGRARVLARFLERPRIYRRETDETAARERQARANIAGEIQTLARGIIAAP